MYQFHIAYVSEDGKAVLSIIDSQTPKTLIDVIKAFLIEERYSYIDEDYASYDTKKLLKIAHEEYNIGSIIVHHYTSCGKVKKDSFYMEHLYWGYVTFTLNKNWIETSSKIVIRNDKFDDEDNEGHIYFEYKNGKMVPLTRFHIKGGEIYTPKENEFYEYVEMDDGLGVVDDILIEKMPENKDDLINVVKKWAEIAGIDISNKTFAFTNKHIAIETPDIIQQLEDQHILDPDHTFSIPSPYVLMFLKNKYPEPDELGAMLDKEDPGVIASVIDNFKTESLLNILEHISSPKKEEVIQLLPQVPDLSFDERKRFIELFDYDDDFVKKRMEVLDKKFEGGIKKLKEKSNVSKAEKVTLDEYTLWKEKMKQ